MPDGGGDPQPTVVPVPTTSTSTVSSTPWSGLQPFLTKAYGGADKALAATPSAPYGGPLRAAPTGAMELGNLLRLTQGQQNLGAGNEVVSLGQRQARGDFLDANQYLVPAIQAAANPIMTNVLTQLLPQIGTAAQKAGAYGGSDMTWARNDVMNNAVNQIADLVVKAAAQNFQTERGFQQTSPQLISAGQALNSQAVADIYGAGTTAQGWNQDQINEALAKYQMSVDAPWQGLSRYMSILSGVGVPASTTSTGTAQQLASIAPSAASAGLGGALAGGLSGLALSAIPGIGIAAPWLAGGGALLGGLGGLFR